MVGRDKLDEIQACVSISAEPSADVSRSIRVSDKNFKLSKCSSTNIPSSKKEYHDFPVFFWLNVLIPVIMQVVLIQVALQTTESNEIAGGVADLVSHINSRFSTLTYQPVVFLHTQDLTFSQYLALLTVADAFLVTSLREGMALRWGQLFLSSFGDILMH